MSLGKISLELQAVVGKFVADLSTAAKAVDGFQRSLDQIGKAGGIAAAGFGALAVVAVKAASDFEQTGNLIERAFGKERARDIEVFASSLSQDVGTSLQETRQGLVSLAMQLKNSLGDTAAAETQSKAITKLAADISAAMNIPFADALNRIQSGLRGETEAIEKLNIFIGEASLKQEALRQGMKQSVETMSEAQKTALRLAAIYRQTADVQGAAAAEAQTFAGQTARLSADLKNLAVELGQVLLPAALELVKAVRSVVNSFRELSPTTQKVAVGLAAAGAAAGAALFAIAGVVSAVGTLVPIVKVLAAAIGPAAASIAAMNLSFAGLAAAIMPVVAVIGTLTAAYTATSLIMAAMGLDTVPENTSAIAELGAAFVEATTSAAGFKRVMLNLLAALTLDGRAIGMSNGGLAASFADAEANEIVAQTLADSYNELTAEERALADASTDLGAAVDGLSGSMLAADAPLAGTAEALAWQKKKTDAATKAAKAYNEALKDQRDFVRALEDSFASLADRTGVADILGDAQTQQARAIADAKKTGGPAAAVERDAALGLIADNFGLKLVALLEGIDTAHFAEAVAKARDAAAILGINFERLVATTPELADRFRNGGATSSEVDTRNDALSAARTEFANITREMSAVLEKSTKSFPELVDVVNNTRETLRGLHDSAQDGGLSLEKLNEAQKDAKQIATEQIAATLSSTTATGAFADAVREAKEAAAKLGIEFDDVVKASKRRTAFDRTQGRLGDTIGQGIGRASFGGLTDLVGGDAEIGKGLSDLLGGTIDSAVGGELSLSSITGLAGAFGAGALGLPPAVGQQIGELVGKAIEAAFAPVTAIFMGVGSAIGDLITSDPRAAAIADEFGAIAGAAGLLAIVFSTLAAAVVAFSIGIAAINPAIAGAVLAFFAVPFVVTGMISSVGILVKETKGYQRAQKIVTRAIDSIVEALEPFGAQFEVIAKLFENIVPIFKPFLDVFSNGEAIGKLLFIVLKGVALTLGWFGIFVAHIINGISGFIAGFFDFFESFLTNINVGGVFDGLISDLDTVGDAFRQFGSIDTDAIQEAMDQVADSTYQSTEDEVAADRAAALEEAKRRARRAAQEKARENAERAAAEAAKKTGDIFGDLRNVANDFKVAYQRFTAADAIVPSNAGRGLGGAKSEAVMAGISISNMTVVSSDPRDWLEKMQRMVDRQQLAKTGTRRTITRNMSGRGES